MSNEPELRAKTLITVLVMAVCGTTGDLLLKRGMLQIGAVQLTAAGLLAAFRTSVANPTIWLAILFLIGFMISNMTVLSWADYSYVMPASALGYAVVTFLGMTALGEVVSVRRWLGVTLICGGVLLVGQTKPRTVSAMEPVH